MSWLSLPAKTISSTYVTKLIHHLTEWNKRSNFHLCLILSHTKELTNFTVSTKSWQFVWTLESTCLVQFSCNFGSLKIIQFPRTLLTSLNSCYQKRWKNTKKEGGHIDKERKPERNTIAKQRIWSKRIITRNLFDAIIYLCI